MPNNVPNRSVEQRPARLKILYVMHVDWEWAKQRPHFIAENLAVQHRVVVCFPYSINRSQLRKNPSRGLPKFPFMVLPGSDQYAFLYRIGTWINQSLSAVLIAWWRPDFIWFCSPEHLEVVPANHGARLVYDCMDDMGEFRMHDFKKENLKRLEKRLVADAGVVFCSSGRLREKLRQRYAEKTDAQVVRNAFDPAPLTIQLSEKGNNAPAGGRHKIGYIGTVSNWLDRDALLLLVNAFEHLEVHLVGPIEIAKPDRIEHERIFWHGPVPHEEIKHYARAFDALFMPFTINELILSVDPVKFYEYIYFNKPIVSIKYPEIERFGVFVDFYSDHGSLKGIIGRYIESGFEKKYSSEAREQFIAQNTWNRRVGEIEQSLYALF